MKTPMQEMLEWVRETLPMDLETPRLITPRLIEHKIESMLEKEKEMMCEFAFNCGDEIKDQNNWRSPRNLTNYEVIQDFYNETFNTKEK